MSGESFLRNPVGIVGVGLMGTAFAPRLRGAGLPVVGFDLDHAVLEGCVRAGEGDLDSTVIVDDIRRRVDRPAAAQRKARS